jgi:hypothetical protein
MVTEQKRYEIADYFPRSALEHAASLDYPRKSAYGPLTNIRGYCPLGILVEYTLVQAGKLDAFKVEHFYCADTPTGGLAAGALAYTGCISDDERAKVAALADAFTADWAGAGVADGSPLDLRAAFGLDAPTPAKAPEVEAVEAASHAYIDALQKAAAKRKLADAYQAQAQEIYEAACALEDEAAGLREELEAAVADTVQVGLKIDEEVEKVAA